MVQKIGDYTFIDEEVLKGADPGICSIAQRMSWAAARETTRTEDRAYSLMGLFNVNSEYELLSILEYAAFTIAHCLSPQGG